MSGFNRRIVLSAAALAAGTAVLGTAARAQAENEVSIGFVLPLSGASATIGNQTRLGAVVAAEQINGAGGIKSLGGAKLKLIFADSQSKPDVGAAETERLIQREKVAMIVGAYNSAVTFPASEVAERYKTPWLVTGAVKDEITERGFKYVFRPNNKAQYDAREQIDAIDLLKQETGKGPARIGLFYEGTDWGRSHVAAIQKLVTARGMQVVLNESYPPNQVDFSAQLLKIRAAKPDAMLVVAYTPDHIRRSARHQFRAWIVTDAGDVYLLYDRQYNRSPSVFYCHRYSAHPVRHRVLYPGLCHFAPVQTRAGAGRRAAQCAPADGGASAKMIYHIAME